MMKVWKEIEELMVGGEMIVVECIVDYKWKKNSLESWYLRNSEDLCSLMEICKFVIEYRIWSEEEEKKMNEEYFGLMGGGLIGSIEKKCLGREIVENVSNDGEVIEEYLERKEKNVDVKVIEEKLMKIYELIRYDREEGEEVRYDSCIWERRVLMFRVMEMLWKEFGMYYWEDESEEELFGGSVEEEYKKKKEELLRWFKRVM